MRQMAWICRLQLGCCLGSNPVAAGRVPLAAGRQGPRVNARAMAEEAEEKPKEMIKLVSKEGHEFSVEKQAAMVSNTIKSMLTGPGMFTENESDTINFPEISKEVLEEVSVWHARAERHPPVDPAPPAPPARTATALRSSSPPLVCSHRGARC